MSGKGQEEQEYQRRVNEISLQLEGVERIEIINEQPTKELFPELEGVPESMRPVFVGIDHEAAEVFEPNAPEDVLGWKSVDCGLPEGTWEVSELDMAKALRFNLMEHIFGIMPNVDRPITYKGNIQPARDCRP